MMGTAFVFTPGSVSFFHILILLLKFLARYMLAISLLKIRSLYADIITDLMSSHQSLDVRKVSYPTWSASNMKFRPRGCRQNDGVTA